MLATVNIINYWFYIDNCFVKASKNYKFAYEVLWIPTLVPFAQFGFDAYIEALVMSWEKSWPSEF